MFDFIEFNHWLWWVLGISLLGIEVLVSGFFLMWAGIAAGIVGFIAWLYPPLPFPVEIFLFAVLSVTNIFLWRMYQKRHPTATSDITLNRRGDQYVGRRLTLKKSIVNGRGKAKIDDTIWKIEGPDCEAGTNVKVVATEGSILKVEPLG